MSEKEPWSPRIDKLKDFQDHKNPVQSDDPPLRMPLAEDDTAPLQGSKDLSDPDSLDDVIADSYEPEEPKTSPAAPARKRPIKPV
jgi:hypothetical protein